MTQNSSGLSNIQQKTKWDLYEITQLQKTAIGIKTSDMKPVDTDSKCK